MPEAHSGGEHEPTAPLTMMEHEPKTVPFLPFMLAMDLSFGRVDTQHYQDAAGAREASAKLWCSWIIFFRGAEGDTYLEVERGGIGFGHDHLNAHIASLPVVIDAREDSGRELATSSRLRLRALGDVTLAQPLHLAVRAFEATISSVGAALSPRSSTQSAEAGSAATAEDSAAAQGMVDAATPTKTNEVPPPERLRAQLAAALVRNDEADAVHDLVAAVQRCLGSLAGADELVDRLVAAMESAPPTDDEMVSLRRLQEGWAGGRGMASYAVSSVWLAALFVRTERCIAARARLTAAVRVMSAEQLRELQHAGTRLVTTELPAVLQSLAELSNTVQRIEQDVGFQESAVRGAKGLSAGLSVAGACL